VACDRFREALSARLDGEPPGLPEADLEAHLAGCPACRDWQEAAAEVTRRARLVLAPPVPDVTAAVLAALPARADARRRLRWADPVLRTALAGVGLGQLVVGLPALVGDGTPMSGPMSGPVHLAHETGAWNVGLAACFLVVAVLPRLAAGALPFLLSFTAVLSWVTVADLGAGHVPAGRVVTHGFLLLGALLVTVLALRARPAWGGPSAVPLRGPVWPRSVRTGGRRRTATAPQAAGPSAAVRAELPAGRRAA
jgi:predicted anti-sigma-YlaC factor YlaD